MAELSPDTLNRLMAILTPPLAGGENARRAALVQAFGPASTLIDSVNYTGSDQVFVATLISTLYRFGEVEPGRPALWALLESVRGEVGTNWQDQIDALRPVLTAPASVTPAALTPMKLFVSYRRKSWGYTGRMVEDLKKRLPNAEIFVDFESIDRDQFKESILGHLRASHGVLVLVTDLTFGERIQEEGDWVRLEIREALRLGKPIIQVGIDGLYAPSKGLPRDIQPIAERQGISLYPEFWHPGMDRLATFIKQAVPITPIPAYVEPPRPVPSQPTPPPEPLIEESKPLPTQRTIRAADVIREVDAIRKTAAKKQRPEELEKAKFLLQSVLQAEQLPAYQLEILRQDLSDVIREQVELREEVERMTVIRDALVLIQALWDRGDAARAIPLWDKLRADFPMFTDKHPEWPKPLAGQIESVKKAEAQKRQAEQYAEIARKREAQDAEIAKQREAERAIARQKAREAARAARILFFRRVRRLVLIGIALAIVGALGYGGFTVYKQAVDNAQATALRATGVIRAQTVIANPPNATALPIRFPQSAWIPAERDFDGVAMVYVPAGCFRMGSDNGGSDERPVHEVCITQPFWLDKYEVSNGQFNKKGGQAGYSSNWTADNLPRETIDWTEANAFCQLRGARLPTEAEWEYAARGPQSLTYPWGNDFVADNVTYQYYDLIASAADYLDLRRLGINIVPGHRTAPVDSRPGGRSWVGAFNLSGNVWEWVSSQYQPYPYKADDGRESMSGNNSRVIRGGSWYGNDSGVRGAVRSWDDVDSEINVLGFRCARF